MEYKEIDNNTYKLHLIKTDKFKTIFFKCIFRNDIKKDDITIRNFLFDSLINSCKKYPTKKSMNIKKQELYDLVIFGRNRRIGRQICTEFCMDILDPKYINDDIISVSLDFLKEIIFNPNITNNEFDLDMFNIEKNSLYSDIISSKEYSKYYSLMKLKENMDKDNPFSFNMDGYLNDLNKITPSNLVEYYNEFINKSIIDIYVVGNIDFFSITQEFNKIFKINVLKKENNNIINNYVCPRKNIKKVIEQSTFNQSRLLLGCYFNNLTDIEKKYTLLLYNIILGASPDSHLFKSVREKKSLTYDINSDYSKNDNILVITTGLSFNNAKLALKTIKEEMNNISKGNIKDEEINNAKTLIISSIKEFEEYPSTITDYYFSKEYLNISDINVSIKEIENISKNDIINVSKKINIDTIYILKEVTHEAN